MAWHGWLGAIVLVVNQALLPWQLDPLARWYTPIMWTGYILLVDAWVLRREGRSLLHDRPREALFMATVSIPLWLVFEGYNVRLRNWAYFGVPENPVVAGIAYAWAFATIWPGLFETAALLGAGPLPTPTTPARLLSRARPGSLSRWRSASSSWSCRRSCPPRCARGRSASCGSASCSCSIR